MLVSNKVAQYLNIAVMNACHAKVVVGNDCDSDAKLKHTNSDG